MNGFEADGIWRSLRVGACGVISWTLASDSKFANCCSELAFGPSALSDDYVHLKSIIQAAINCMGQMAIHDFSGDRSSRPLLEPRDDRWNVLGSLPVDSLDRICLHLSADQNILQLIREERQAMLSQIYNGHSGISPSCADHSRLIEQIVHSVSRELQIVILAAGQSFPQLVGSLARAAKNAGRDCSKLGKSVGMTPGAIATTRAMIQRRQFYS